MEITRKSNFRQSVIFVILVISVVWQLVFVVAHWYRATYMYPQLNGTESKEAMKYTHLWLYPNAADQTQTTKPPAKQEFLSFDTRLRIGSFMDHIYKLPIFFTFIMAVLLLINTINKLRGKAGFISGRVALSFMFLALFGNAYYLAYSLLAYTQLWY